MNFENGKIQQDLIDGFLQNGIVLGRPAHIVEGKNRELYLSDVCWEYLFNYIKKGH